jgi:ribose transport system substrate-binding protein
MSDELQKLSEVVSSRRDVLKTLGATTVAGALLASAGFDPAMAQDLMGAKSPMKAAMSNAGLQATWCAQGKQAAEAWGKLLNVEVTWFDGELSATKQRATIDNMATQKWDFAAIQTFGIGTLNDPVSKMIDGGTPIIAMDTMMAPEGQLALHTFIAPDNIFMGSVTAKALFDSIGGEGQVVMTQGALGHTGAQGRAKGFHETLKNYPKIEMVDDQPADWDVTKVARIWDSLLTKFPDLKGGFFHNDDMALAAYNVIKAKGRESGIKLSGIDAMPPAVNAVIDGTLVATVRNPSCRIHGWSVASGVAAVQGGEKTGKDIPAFIWADGPVVTKDTAAGMLWLQKNFLI